MTEITRLNKRRLRKWLESADDPAQRAWLNIRNGPNALTNTINYLRVRNGLPREDADLLEALLYDVARQGFEMAKDAYEPYKGDER